VADVERLRLALPAHAPVLDVLDLFPRRVKAQLWWGGFGWSIEFSCERDYAEKIAIDVSKLVQAAHRGGARDADSVRLERAA
jgi:hypothetical protein